MSFRSRTSPDQRRRRVMLDEKRNDDAITAPPRSGRRKRYADNALGDAQPRVTDFLPSSWRRIAAWLILLAVTDAVIVTLHWFHSDWSVRVEGLPLHVLNATQSGSLCHLWLMLQAIQSLALCLLIFAVRRRRLDDLRGTSQVWIWATFTCGLLLLICGTDIRGLISFGLRQIPNLPQLSAPQAYFWTAIAAFFVPVAVRLLVEMRRVRLAQVLLLASVLCCVAGEVAPALAQVDRVVQTVISALMLVSVTLLSASLLAYGRYVKLDASGVFRGAGRKKRRKRVPAEDEEVAGDESEEEAPQRTRIDAGSTGTPRPNSLGAAIKSARSNDLDGLRGGPLSSANRGRSGR